MNCGDLAERWDHTFGARRVSESRQHLFPGIFCTCLYQDLGLFAFLSYWKWNRFWLLCCSLSSGFIPSPLLVLFTSGAQRGRPPSSVASASGGAWLWRNRSKSAGRRPQRFPLIYICLTPWLTEPIGLSRPWRRTDAHLQVRWGWDDFEWLAGCHGATGASQNLLCTAGQRCYAHAWVCVPV